MSRSPYLPPNAAQQPPQAQQPSVTDVISTNKVLRSTYILLSMTLLFSAAIAGAAVYFDAPILHWGIHLLGVLGLYFLVYATKNSAIGIVSVFAFTGFLGYSLGTMLNPIMQVYANGADLITIALGLTGLAFVTLSAIALNPKRDFSFLSQFLFAGLIIVLGAVVISFFVQSSILHMAISTVMVLLMSGFILYDTNAIVKGGETNYIVATANLYLDIYLLFKNLLMLLLMFAGDE